MDTVWSSEQALTHHDVTWIKQENTHKLTLCGGQEK